MKQTQQRPLILMDINNLIDQFDGSYKTLNQLIPAIESHLQNIKDQIPNMLVFDHQNNLYSNFLTGGSSKCLVKTELSCSNVIVIQGILSSSFND